MNYTNYLEESMFVKYNPDDATEESIMAFLTAEESFRDFGSGLKEMVRKYMPVEYVGTEESFLKSKVNENAISFNRGTVKNWFSGGRPKKSAQSREHMYRISFALNMSLEDTVLLFSKVYLDKPFNMRNVREFIYFYCIKNQFNYEHAEEMISKVTGTAEAFREDTLYTQVLKDSIDTIASDQEVIDFIHSHPHNFEINNRTAGIEVEKLLGQIRISKVDVEAWKKGQISSYDPKYSYLIREIGMFIKYRELQVTSEVENTFVGKNKSLTSIETMLDIITMGTTRGDSTKLSGKSIFKESKLPKEITNRFPIKKSFSTKPENLSFEELRKMLILLFSYKFWFHQQYLKEVEADLEDYQIQLDLLLQKCGLQTLYYGNPFDWLFMYCTITDNPLDTFRSIIEEGGGAW